MVNIDFELNNKNLKALKILLDLAEKYDSQIEGELIRVSYNSNTNSVVAQFEGYLFIVVRCDTLEVIYEYGDDAVVDEPKQYTTMSELYANYPVIPSLNYIEERKLQTI